MKTDPLVAAQSVTRRSFLVRCAVGIGAAISLRARPSAFAAPETAPGELRAAIIGHTGRGDYGHGLDVVFKDLPGVEVVAVADPHPAGRETAAKKSGALRQYADYREMLAKEKPRLVSVAPRWTDQHHAMGMAALKAGAHVVSEKPFTQTLAEADELLATADRAGLKIAVAHQMRLSPSIVHLKRRLDEGLIGELAQLRAWGKQDARAGGEDMLVLGTHVFDLMRQFAGDPLWCTARVLHDSRDITRSDARKPTEEIGPIAGNQIDAQFAFPRGVTAFFTSRGKLRETVAHWGIELIGSKGTARILMDIDPTVYVLPAGKWQPDGRTDQWRRLEDDPVLKLSADQRGFGPANRRVVDDWIEAIRANREPACSGRNAMKAIEMVMAVYHAALGGTRVNLPLVERGHPLGAG
jgi:predicted dehydrogenase